MAPKSSEKEKPVKEAVAKEKPAKAAPEAQEAHGKEGHAKEAHSKGAHKDDHDAKAKKAKEEEEEHKSGPHAPFHSKSLSREDSHCQVGKCTRRYRAKGYCAWHYKQWRHGKFAKQRFTPCKENNCFRPMAMNRLGECEQHYQDRYVKGIAAAKPVKAAAPKAEPKVEAEAKVGAA